MKTEYLTFERPGGGNRPFSDAVRAGKTYYISGLIGLDENGSPPPDASDEARLLMDGLRRVLENCKLTTGDLVQVTIYTPDVSLYDQFNAVYVSYFKDRLPARALLGSGPLLFGARFELTAVAVKG